MITPDEFIELCQCGETTTVQYKECFTSQTKIAQEMVAFANTRGGIILFGVQDKTGALLGLSFKQLQETGSALGNTANEQVKPAIYIDTDVVKVGEKRFLVCQISEGKNKPYKTNNGEIWVKQGQDKRRVTENSEILQLFQDSGNYHAEEANVRGTSIKDIEMTYLREYFYKVYDREIEDFNQPLESMLCSLGIMTKRGELTRAGLLYFAKNPQQFEYAFKIKAVAFVGNSIGGSEYIDSRDIAGTIPWMFREGMAFLKSMLHHRQEGQNFNSLGILEIPEVVLEELLQNALIHLDLLHPAAIRLLIFPNRIEIINPGRLYGGLQVTDIRLGASKQRNPLLANFASHTMIFRGLGSGIVRSLRENVFIDFINEEEANQFRVIIWRTTQKGSVEDVTTTQKNDTTTQKGIIEDIITTQKNDIATQKQQVEDINTTQKNKYTTQKTESTTQKAVLDYFRNNPKGTRIDAANAIPELSEDGIKYTIRRLQQLGLLKREGGRKNGYWVVIEP